MIGYNLVCEFLFLNQGFAQKHLLIKKVSGTKTKEIIGSFIDIVHAVVEIQQNNSAMRLFDDADDHLLFQVIAEITVDEIASDLPLVMNLMDEVSFYNRGFQTEQCDQLLKCFKAHFAVMNTVNFFNVWRNKILGIMCKNSNMNVVIHSGCCQ